MRPPPHGPRTHSRPGGAAATWGVARGWQRDRTPLWSPLRGPRFPRSAGASEPSRSLVPHNLKIRPHLSRAGGNCRLREALRLRAETQPGTPPCAAPLPAGQDPVGCSESEAAWLPGSVPRGCSPLRPHLLRLPGHTVRSSSCRSHGLCFPPFSL